MLCDLKGCLSGSDAESLVTYPKGPKIEIIQDRPPGLKFTSEIEIFKRVAHQTPIYCWEFGSSEIENVKRD